MQGLVIENIANIYKIEASGKTYNAVARGKLKQEGRAPLVGDRVEFDAIEEGEEIDAVINEITPRTNELKRPKITNISQVVFIISTKNPKPDLLMLDKQLCYAEYLKIKPIIVINKIDLSDSYKKIIEIYQNAGFTIIGTSAKQQIGVEQLKKILQNKTSVLSGNSGVGKSTLLNALFNKNITLEGEISKKNKKGKNTTTTVKLYKLEEDTFIADTPGFANFDLSEIESGELANYFIDFKQYIKNCEYVGCTHIKEENCGIKHALENGQISPERYSNFCKIYSELKEKEKRKW